MSPFTRFFHRILEIRDTFWKRLFVAEVHRGLTLEEFTGKSFVVIHRHENWLLNKLISDRLASLGLRPLGVIALRPRSGVERFGRQNRIQRTADQVFCTVAAGTTEPCSTLPVTLLAGNGPKPFPLSIPVPLDFPFLPLGEVWTFIILLWYRKQLSLRVGPELPCPDSSHFSHFYRSVSRTLYRQEKSARGVRNSSGERAVRVVLADARVRAKIQSLAIERGLSVDEAQKLAEKHLREIAATMSGFSVQVMRRILKPLFETIFSSIESNGAERLRELAESHPIVLLPCHRSHFDYLLISYALDRAGISLPFIAAGDNLNFFPVGKLLRSSGGFFIRRTIESDALYKFVLQSYLTYLVKSGQTLEFYIEGGRSRTGEMLDPKLGLLKYLVQSLIAGSRRDLLLVPVGISYERVPEDKTLIREKLGMTKQRESLWQFLKLQRIWRMQFGGVSMKFGEPISLQGFFASQREAGAQLSEIRADEVGALTAKLGRVVQSRIREQIPLQLTNLLALSLVRETRESIPLQEAIDRTVSIVELFTKGGIPAPLSEAILARKAPVAQLVADQVMRCAAAQWFAVGPNDALAIDGSAFARERIRYYARPAVERLREYCADDAFLETLRTAHRELLIQLCVRDEHLR